MKTSFLISVAAGFAVSSGTASSAVSPYRATLNGQQLVPAIGVEASGEANLELDDEQKTLGGTVSYRGLSGAPTTVEIHTGACGLNGATEISLDSVGPTSTAVDVDLSDKQIDDLAAGKLYIAVRTAVHVDGEIRGQLYYPRPPKSCPPSGADAGSDAGPTSRGGFSSGPPASTGPAPGGPWSAVSTERRDAGISTRDTSAVADDGCSTTSGALGRGSWRAHAIGLAMIALASRCRKRYLAPLVALSPITDTMSFFSQARASLSLKRTPTAIFSMYFVSGTCRQSHPRHLQPMADAHGRCDATVLRLDTERTFSCEPTIVLQARPRPSPVSDTTSIAPGSF
jgi:hypothetical protein